MYQTYPTAVQHAARGPLQAPARTLDATLTDAERVLWLALEMTGRAWCLAGVWALVEVC